MNWKSAALIALVTLSLAGCGSGNFSKSQESGVADTLRYPIPNNPTSLDSALVQDGDTLDMLQQVYEGLVGWGPDNDVVGLLAESWEVSEDGLTYTFKLRDGVKFHNGREVTADDVKWSIERACQPAMTSQTADAYLSDVVGLTDMVEGRANSVSGITVIDSGTISITLTQPTPYFLGRLTYLVSAVVAKEAVPASSSITKKEEMVGTGPYKVERYDDKQLVILVANEDYWGGAPKLKRIERPVILNAATRLDKFVNGELDVVQIQRADLKAVLEKPDLKDKVKYFPRPAIWYVGLNQNEYAPFKDRRVRQAFAMSIDRDRIVGELMGGVNTAAYTIVPPGVVGHREKGAGLPFDPEGAKKLLAEAGYPNGKGLPPLEMTHREGYPDIKLVAEAVAGMIKKNLGVEVRVQPMEWAKYLEVYNAKKQVFFHMRWAADYLDPQNFLSHMLATWGPENKIGYNNAQFDALCKKADTMMDMEGRIPLYQQAEDILLNDAVWVPIYFQRDIELHRPGVLDMRESLFGHLPHTTTRLSQ